MLVDHRSLGLKKPF